MRNQTRGQAFDSSILSFLWNVGIAYYHARQYDKALAEVEKSLETHPDSGSTYFLRGLILTKRWRTWKKLMRIEIGFSR